MNQKQKHMKVVSHRNNKKQVYTFDQFAQKVENIDDGRPINKMPIIQNPMNDNDLKEFKELLDDKQYNTQQTKKKKNQGAYSKPYKPKGIAQQKRMLDLEKFINSDDNIKPQKTDYIRAYKDKSKSPYKPKKQNKESKSVKFDPKNDNILQFLYNEGKPQFEQNQQHQDEENLNDELQEGQIEQQNNEKKAKRDQDFVKNMEERNKRFEERRKQKKKKMQDEMKKVCSFQPKIDKKSRLIDNKRIEQNQAPRYEVLHELNYVMRERDQEMQDYMEQLQEERFYQKEGKECTFKPNINNYETKISGNMSIEERGKLWAEKKQQKLERERQMIKNRELDGCTFKPITLKKKFYSQFNYIFKLFLII